MSLPLFSKRLSHKSKFLILIAIVVIVYLISTHALFQNVFSKKITSVANKHSIKRVKLDNVVVHLDLKGSPPKLSYLKTLLPKLQDLGVTGLLIEYEDMFPYDGRLSNLSARNCYNKSEKFLSLAVHIGFDIIPLVQIFGHMEHVLKLAEFRHLRELPGYPDSLCPSKHASQALVKHMLQQVIMFHAEISPLKYIHIGCDEVFHINKCRHCVQRKLNNTDIYINHVRKVTDIIKGINPDIKALVWDDMFRGFSVSKWNTIQYPDIDFVYWDYTSDLKSVSHVNMMKYHNTGRDIWIASAFKGAEGELATYPDIKERFSNNLSWMNFILDYKFGGENEIFSFKGIILTGWSRYSHMEPPCELLPVAIPSLYLNLLAINKFKSGVDTNKLYDSNIFFTNYMKKDLSDNLHCDETKHVDYFDTYHCFFDGNELNQLLRHWDSIEKSILKKIYSIKSSLSAIEFYSKTRNINMNKILDSLNWCNNSIKEITTIRKKMIKSLSQYYDDFFVEEYTNFKLYNTKKMLDNLVKHLTNMLSTQTWDRRPYK